MEILTIKYDDMEVFLVLEAKKTIYDTLEENVAYMNSILPIKESFDLLQRDIIIGERKCTFYFIDGLTKDESMVKIMASFFGKSQFLVYKKGTPLLDVP